MNRKIVIPQNEQIIGHRTVYGISGKTPFHVLFELRFTFLVGGSSRFFAHEWDITNGSSLGIFVEKKFVELLGNFSGASEISTFVEGNIEKRVVSLLYFGPPPVFFVSPLSIQPFFFTSGDNWNEM